MNTFHNYIYLLREREFIKTDENIYKIGRTQKPNLDRIKSYPNGSDLIFYIKCDDCVTLEKRIIHRFIEVFNLRKDIGNEYFEGDWEEMVQIVMSLWRNECPAHEVDSNENDDENDDGNSLIRSCFDAWRNVRFDSICSTVCEIFPDYKNDESFGGVKKYIKIRQTDGHLASGYTLHYINPSLLNYIQNKNSWKFKNNYDGFRIYNNEITKEINIFENDIDVSSTDYSLESNMTWHSNSFEVYYSQVQYFQHLVHTKKILLNEVIDINSDKFLKTLIKTKCNINIEHYDEFKKHGGKKDLFVTPKQYCKNYDYGIYGGELDWKMREKIRTLFVCNCVINNELYSNVITDDIKDTYYYSFKKMKRIKNYDCYKVYIEINSTDDIGMKINGNINRIYNIDSKFYDYKTFRKFTHSWNR